MIKTRFLILSDTHGAAFHPTEKPEHEVDVAIHCGDITDESKIEEFRNGINLLRNINSPLKLVIAGNHDFTLDIPAFEKKIAETRQSIDPELIKQHYGSLGEARKLFNEAKLAGIQFLDEGEHQFTLANGAALTVFASPYTPALGEWGFQYSPISEHNFSIQNTADVVITHGPPKGILDFTQNRERAGCQQLFAHVAKARPRIHCFGHIHEGWGAKVVAWKDLPDGDINHFTAIDNDTSHLVEKLSTILPTKFDSADDKVRKAQKLSSYRRDNAVFTSHCADDEHPVINGTHTLFINASISDTAGQPSQLPWLVDVELPAAR